MFHAIFDARISCITWLCDKEFLSGAKWSGAFAVLIWEGKRGNMPPKGSESRHRKKKGKKSNPNGYYHFLKNPIIFNLLVHISCSPGVSCYNDFQDFPWNVEIPLTQTMASLVLLVFWKHKNMFVFSCDPLGEFPHWFGVWDFYFFNYFYSSKNHFCQFPRTSINYNYRD